MRDCGGYGGAVRDICGDAGIVGGADAMEFAERVGGVSERRPEETGKKTRKKTRKKITQRH
jgi:hypothetical protein